MIRIVCWLGFAVYPYSGAFLNDRQLLSPLIVAGVVNWQSILSWERILLARILDQHASFCQHQRCSLPDYGWNLPLILRASGEKGNGNQVEDGFRSPGSRFQVSSFSWCTAFSTARVTFW